MWGMEVYIPQGRNKQRSYTPCSWVRLQHELQAFQALNAGGKDKA